MQTQHFYLIAGNTKELTANIEMSTPDFNGFSIKWFVKKAIWEPGKLITKTHLDGITPTGKQLAIRIKTADTKALPPGLYYHECKVTDQNGEETTLFGGDLTMYASGD